MRRPRRAGRDAQGGDPIVLEIVKVLPNLLWFGLAVIVFLMAYKPLVARLEQGDISKVSFATLQIEFVRSEFAKAAQASGSPATAFSTPANFAGYAERIQRSASKIKGAYALWVDDGNPTETFQERRALASLGIAFDLARSNEEAQSLFDLADKTKSPYDFIISDIGRDKATDPQVAPCFPLIAPGHEEAGCKLIQIVRGRYPERTPPIILYSGDGDARGVPAGAFGATDRFDELVALVLDAVERREASPVGTKP